MRRFFIFLGLLTAGSLLICASSAAQELPPNVSMTIEDKSKAPAADPAPQFKAVSELSFNAGEIDAPGSVDREFSFRNEGGAPLEIKEVKSGCGCLVASYDPIIQPGAEGVISISMKVYPEWDGREVSRTTWVMTNDPQNPQIRLTTSAKARAAAKPVSGQ